VIPKTAAITRVVSDRFWSKVDATAGAGGCWPWVASLNRTGYGQLSCGRVPRLAHRISWTLHNGPIPRNQHVLHTCDNPACVNPAHLFIGSQADNMRDMAAKGRQARGDRQGQAKITERDVREIRCRAADGETQRSLAHRFGISQVEVQRVCARERWGWVA
jgi:hypothetical protein